MNKAVKPKKGIILVMVLGVMALLGVLLFGFHAKSKLNVKNADSFRRSQQAIQCCLSGINIAMAAINHLDNEQAKIFNNDLFVKDKTFNLKQGRCIVSIKPERSKINVNLLKEKNGRLNNKRIQIFLRLIDILNKNNPQFSTGYGIVPAIIDWTDSDDDVTTIDYIRKEKLGAESAFYQQKTTAYKCPNTQLSLTDELLQVRGINPEIYTGLADHITVFGDGKININYASKTVIQSLSEHMDSVLADMIIERRSISEFSDVKELQDVPGITDKLYQDIKNQITVDIKEHFYKVRATGIFENKEYYVEAILKRNSQSKSVEIIWYKEYK